MKFQPDPITGTAITAHGPGWVAVNGQRHENSVIVSTQSDCTAWDCARFEDLQAHHFAQLAALDVEIVLFGSGPRIRFPQAAWLAALYARRIGVETMDTAAACRTFNFLAGEGRKVAAALLL